MNPPRSYKGRDVEGGCCSVYIHVKVAVYYVEVGVVGDVLVFQRSKCLLVWGCRFGYSVFYVGGCVWFGCSVG